MGRSARPRKEREVPDRSSPSERASPKQGTSEQRRIPDLADPRYLDEVGWFLYHEAHHRDQFEGSYEEERLEYSRLLMEGVLRQLDQDVDWLRDKRVVTVGAGCTADLSTWPAAVKVAVDPLLYTYQKLGLLLEDQDGTNPTVFLSTVIDEVPLVDRCADLVLCRNALDHTPRPDRMLDEIWRMLDPKGHLYLSVDIGGKPTPDEPTVFSPESLSSLVRDRFEVSKWEQDPQSHSDHRLGRIRILARKKELPEPTLDRGGVLAAYEARLEEG